MLKMKDAADPAPQSPGKYLSTICKWTIEIGENNYSGAYH